MATDRALASGSGAVATASMVIIADSRPRCRTCYFDQLQKLIARVAKPSVLLRGLPLVGMQRAIDNLAIGAWAQKDLDC